MSHTALQAAALVDVKLLNLNPTSIMVMYRLAHHHNRKTGRCFPSQDTLADGCNASRRAVQMAVEQLVETGLVRLAPPEDVPRTPGRPSNSYQLAFIGQMAKLHPGRFKRIEGDGFSASISEFGAMDAHQQGKEQGNLEQEKTPKPPRGARTPVSIPDDVREAAERIKGLTPGRAGKRCTTPEICEALVKGMAAGERDLGLIEAGLRAYYGDPDKARENWRYASGAVVMINGAKWREWLPDDALPARSGPPAASGRAPPRDLAPLEIQHGWMRSWVEHDEDLREGFWRHNRGPMPGQEGCRVSDEVQRHWGVEPYCAGGVNGSV